MANYDLFGDPNRPRDTAAERACAINTQPNTRPLGYYTGAPPQTILKTERVAPFGMAATKIVPATRENRFVTLTAPSTNFTIYVAGSAGVSANFGIALVNGVPYEVNLPGNQELFAISNAPGITLPLSIQISPAIAGDLERRLPTLPPGA